MRCYPNCAGVVVYVFYCARFIFSLLFCFALFFFAVVLFISFNFSSHVFPQIQDGNESLFFKMFYYRWNMSCAKVGLIVFSTNILQHDAC